MPDAPLAIVDQGLRDGVDWPRAKTGLYLDQRENRAAAARMRAAAASWTCSAIRADSVWRPALGKAREVLGYDSSQRAVAQARDNAERNGLDNLRFESGDTFETFMPSSRPASGSTASSSIRPSSPATVPGVDDALRAYARLNRLGLDVLAPGGILVTCSCSGHVSRDDFFFMLVAWPSRAAATSRCWSNAGRLPITPFRSPVPKAST